MKPTHDASTDPRVEITPEPLFRDRRRLLAAAGLITLGTALSGRPARAGVAPGALALGPDDPVTPFEQTSSYNNFYEYSTDKKAVRVLAENLRPAPWRLEVTGEVATPRVYDVAELGATFGTDERVYRFRCVEGWSAVIPWEGIPLAKILDAAEPTARARFVRFTGPYDPSRFYGQRDRRQPWPYVEGLTLEEAMHPLTLMATGMYGRPLPNQCGAPVRLVVPWKYGYKSIKSVVKISLESTRPETFWMRLSPSEYGFHANVNPDLAHPRWSQAREVRLGEMRKRPTLPFNGYAAEVAHLYRGIDPAALR